MILHFPHCSIEFSLVQSVLLFPLNIWLHPDLKKCMLDSPEDDFSIVETNHSIIIGVCGMFGSFVKFVVVLVTELTDEVQTLQKRPKVSESTTRGLPSHIGKEKNRKDQLYNAIIDLFRE